MQTKYHILTSHHRDVLQFKIHGECNSENADNIASDVIRIMIQHRPSRVLVDVRELEGRLNTGETFFHVRKYPTDLARYKIAIVELDRNHEYCEFYELAATNLGHNLRCFYDEGTALQWLDTKGTALAS